MCLLHILVTKSCDLVQNLIVFAVWEGLRAQAAGAETVFALRPRSKWNRKIANLVQIVFRTVNLSSQFVRSHGLSLGDVFLYVCAYRLYMYSSIRIVVFHDYLQSLFRIFPWLFLSVPPLEVDNFLKIVYSNIQLYSEWPTVVPTYFLNLSGNVPKIELGSADLFQNVKTQISRDFP